MREDLEAAGDVIWEIQFLGSKRVEVGHHESNIYSQMAALRERGDE